MHKKIRLALMMIVLSSAGVALAAPAHEILNDGQALAKMGLLGFMGVCLVTLIVAVVALCKFIVTLMLPLKEALIRFTDASEHQAENLKDVSDAIKECRKG